ncbi:ImmA/IrrE family metallo-endopeptidase [Ectobacillus ponti]|uniref:ImmA/IrrE family metallo-endopeptidase n=1 Tax=Ectobacillus ponti TaxID=2961894 RepID=A0AA41X828_9BACI|nr:ImmA/IrrE family metallo-endopeptidase [Ectobacillus ponti]MCP8970532.1 ImmA/IrrE family metallo-endopeptidase [Ectobacillus ponti]
MDSRLPDLQRRQAFFHELCHILRHEGLQGAMPPLFREWQEWDAVNFARCAAIPRHMLHYIRLDGDAVAHASEVFQVPPRLCEERLQQILNRKREASAL